MLRQSLTSSNIDQNIIPGGCTEFIQACDVSWNKSFKAMCKKRYDQWLAAEGIHNETEEDNMKAPPRKRVDSGIVEIHTKNIKHSFKSCALNIDVDGSEDNISPV